MRPLRVCMQAFGPFAAAEEVDFAELGPNTFFLITGPTGSGKTTVLDAMCFALYGETTGGAEKDGGRGGADMRSQHAAPGVLTEVEFDFAVGDQLYRARRSPEQQRPKKVGEGTTTAAQDASLWRLGNEDDGPAEQGRPLATGWSAVTKRAEDILGFRAGQFRQVVMLPQGRFQDLLRADSRAREEILTNLFDTGFYSRIEWELKERAGGVRKEYEGLAGRRAVVLEQAGVSDREALATELAATEAAAADAATEWAARSDEQTAAQKALHDAETVADKLAEAEREAGALAALEAHEPAVSADRDRLAAARAAALLDDAAHAAAVRDAERGGCELRSARAAEALADSRRQADEATALLAREEALAPQREAAGDEVRRLAALAADVTQLEERSVALAAAASALRDAQAAEQGLSGAARSGSEALDDARRALTDCETAAAAAGGLRSLAAEARATAQRRAELEGAAERCSVAQTTIAPLEARDREATAALDQARQRAGALQTAWDCGQAGLLAATLQPGVPCPVCGSPDHPCPAPVGDAPDADALKAARDAVDEAQTARDAAAAALTAARRDWEEVTRALEHLAKTLGEAAGMPLEECEALASAAEAERDAAARAAAELPARREQAGSAEARLAETAALHDAAVAAVAEAGGAAAAAQALVDELAAAVPPELRDTQALAAAQALAAERRDLLDGALGEARERARRAGLTLAAAEAAIKAADHELATAARAARDAETAFATRLAQQGFEDREAWHEARLTAAEVDELAAAVEAHDAALAATRTRLERAVSAASGLSTPDLDGLAAAAAAARERAEQAAAAKAGHEASLGALATAQRQLGAIDAAATGLEHAYEVLGHVANVAGGSNQLHLSFQRYVLGAFLDGVLAVATQRLRLMTSNRYQLQRTEASRGHGKAAGLELTVFDAWTGYARPVSTLSGGETFMAALSLALALAEVVQSYSGGIRLDTVFVDEGFGALDDEALDLAVTALGRLRDGGRLVGVISHVAELKERIPARLEVVAGKSGSHARFVLP